MQTPLISSNILAGTWFVFNKGLNMPEQDIPNMSSEPNNILLLIAKQFP